MLSYLQTLKDIMENGRIRKDRTGVGTRSIFGTQTRYDLSKGFPAVTTKRLAFKAVVSELLWFLEGSEDERRLAEILHGTRDLDKKTIWTANANAEYWTPRAKYDGDAGRIYGVQWTNWRTFKPLAKSEDELVVGNYTITNQIIELINGIKNDPYSRRHVVVSYNPGELDEMALPPCHAMFQMYVSELSQEEINHTYRKYRSQLDVGGRKRLDSLNEGQIKTIGILEDLGLPTAKLSCQMYQRSQDVFLGGPFNLASYSLLTHMIAQVTGLEVGEFIHTTGDAHIYSNHIEQVKEQLSREPFPLPTLWLNPEIKNIFDFTMDDIKLMGYDCHGPIKAEMAV
jgi:thymidylate synthase